VSHESPTAVADLLLLAVARASAEGLQITATRGGKHLVTLEQMRGEGACLELNSTLADAVIARLALLASLDFTARDERMGRIKLAVGESKHEMLLSVTPGEGRLSAYLRPVRGYATASAQTSSVHHTPTRIGDYRVLGELGRGALGVVLSAEHVLLGKTVAIKLWSLPNTETSVANAALLREARAASATRHPGVVDVYDVLRMPDGRVAVVMELLEGETLAARITQLGALEVHEAVRIARAVADTLDATHASGVIHRDLKPENVFVLPDGRIKVVDFGAAVNAARESDAPSTLGTPWYLAPEQALGKAPDRRSDIYSLGCVLFEMLSAKCPFDGPDPRVVIAKHLEQPAPTVQSPRGPLPEALERLVARTLAKEPDHRHQSARELIAELDVISGALSRTGWRKWLAV
jgi:serine/threonine protein kinase